jgi:hypothetical protein
MAISLLTNIDAEECYGNIFSENFDKNHYKNCRNGIRNFLSMPNLKQFLQKFYVGPICSTALNDAAAKDNLIKNDADPENKARSSNTLTDLFKNKADPVNISAIKEDLRASLLSIASRLLKSEHTRLHHLSEAEQQLWNSFEKAEIYKFLTGEKDTIPEFQFNWISPEAPAICQVHSAFPAQPVAPPVLSQPAAPLPVVLPAPVVQPVDAQPPTQLPVQLQPQPQPVQDADIAQPVPLPEEAKAVQVKPKIPDSDRQLRQRKEIDYNKFHSGIKKTC